MAKGNKAPRENKKKAPMENKRKHSPSPEISAEGAHKDPEQKQEQGSSNSQSDSREIKRLKDALAQKDKALAQKDQEIETIYKAYHKESLDFLIQKSLHLEDSISQIKDYGSDDLAIVKFLFDVSSVEDALRRISKLDSHLARKNDERCYKSVGRLLIGATMFYLKAYDFPEPFIPPTGTKNSTHDEVRFDLEIENCQTDLGPLRDIFESTDKWKDLIVPILNIYTQTYAENPSDSETIAARHIAHVIHQLVSFLNIVTSRLYRFSEQQRYDVLRIHGSELRRPDGFLRINGKIEIIVEFKVFSMLPKERFNGSNAINIDISDMKNPFKQTFCYSLDTGCPRVLVSDGRTSVFFLFDYEKAHSNREHWKAQGKAIAPIRVFSSNCMFAFPSFLESHLAWMLIPEKETIQKSKMDDMKQFYIDMKKILGSPPPSRPGSKSSSKSEGTISSSVNKGNSNVGGSLRDDESLGQGDVMDSCDLSTTRPTTAGSGEDINEIAFIYIDYGEAISISSGYSAFQIFKVDADKLPYVEHNLNAKEQVVVKIFDDTDFFEYWSRTNLARPLPIYMEQCYQRERHCINRLLEDPEFNNCYFKHEEAEVRVNVGLWDTFGKCILSRFIDTIELPKDDETYNKAKQQLDIIHKHGILHDDIKKDNILYSKEGTVYIIDFGVSHILDSKHKAHYADDDECLWDVFYG